MHYCQVCSKEFRTKTKLYNHGRNHLPKDKKCPHCNFITNFTSTLTLHIFKKHGETLAKDQRTPLKHRCGCCQKFFTEKKRVNIFFSLKLNF